MFKEFEISTEEHYQLINITDKLQDIVRKGKIKNGLVSIFVPHTTAAVLVTEDETGLKQDWLKILERIVSNFDFAHNRCDNNGASHILAGLVGPSKTFIVRDNGIILGTWQQIFLAEFDGPRKREIFIKIVSD